MQVGAVYEVRKSIQVENYDQSGLLLSDELLGWFNSSEHLVRFTKVI